MADLHINIHICKHTLSVFILRDCQRSHHANTLSPIIERMKVVMKKMRQKVAGAWKNTIPTITAPTAPIPVHTG